MRSSSSTEGLILGLVLDLLVRQSICGSLHLESRSHMEGLIHGLALDLLVWDVVGG